jgi:hypothetical protein
MRVLVDGEPVLERRYEPSGLSSAGQSSALERIGIKAGRHVVRVELNDTGEAGAWRLHEVRTLVFRDGQRHVLRFETARGFTWE